MSKRGNGYGENRVNILKKVKVGKIWNFYPAVVEPNGKLRDKVLGRGHVQVHLEGCYYIEWRKDDKEAALRVRTQKQRKVGSSRAHVINRCAQET